jgi:hypothetical protein
MKQYSDVRVFVYVTMCYTSYGPRFIVPTATGKIPAVLLLSREVPNGFHPNMFFVVFGSPSKEMLDSRDTL